MKKLTIEEKAKAYDEIIKKANKMNSENCEACQMCIEELIPELKESEDERIRKWIINDIRYNMNNEPLNNSEYKKEAEKAIAWLEKQGESDETKAKMCLINKGYPIDTNGVFPTYEEMYNIIREGLEQQSEQNLTNKVEPKFKVGNIIIKSKNSDINTFGKFKITNIKDNRYWYNEFVICKISEQDEWELAKIKPNFKVGDWLVHNERRNIIKVINATPFFYEVVDVLGYHHTITDTAIENNYNLWTIQDAKDGDVLVSDYEGGVCITILKSVVSSNKIEMYCHSINSELFIAQSGFSNATWHPAAKEQRDTLMKAMADAGYTFDFEKKELKKIEQNPAWSEEDEKKFRDVIRLVEQGAPVQSMRDHYTNWLKSLKNKCKELW